MLKTGDKAPDFSGSTYDGKTLALKDFKGKKLVLYFYPKDNTPGCTAEACNLRDNYSEFKKRGYEIVGVSADNEKAHKNFTEKYQLPFPLLCDTNKTICKQFGVWGSKKFMGRTFDGIHRTTFVISEQGVIEEVIEKVETKNHTGQLLK